MITMKKIIKILFAILILLIIFAGITTLLQKDILNGPGLDEYTKGDIYYTVLKAEFIMPQMKQ